MTLITGPKPYDLDNLLGGGARVLATDDLTVTVPTKLSDIIKLTSALNYAPNTGWKDFGAARESTTYSRNFSADGYTIQQTSGNVLEEITEVSRTLATSIAEITPEHLQMLEEANAITTIAATVGTNSAEKAVKMGAFTDLTRRRVAFIGQRSKQSGTVSETGPPAVTRGRFVALCLYNVAITADSADIELAKGNLAHVPVSFTAFPEPGQASNQEYGVWFSEDAAGTI